MSRPRSAVGGPQIIILALTLSSAVFDSNLPADQPTTGTRVSAQDWATYNHGVTGWRFNAAERSLNKSNASDLVEKWRFPAKDAPLKIGAIHATPTVVNGHVYFGTATFPAFYKLRPDGTPVWVYRVDNNTTLTKPSEGGVNRIGIESGIMTSALVTDESVYFGNSAGVFFALDRFSGRERWKVDTRAEGFPNHHSANGFFASPIFANGRVIVGGGAYEHPYPLDPEYPCCSGRGFVVAFDPTTGGVEWKYDVGEPPRQFPEPIVLEDANGKHTFKFGPSTSSVWSTPSFDEATNTLFFGTDVHNSPRQPTEDNPDYHTKYSAAIIAVDADTGQEKWVTQLNEGDIFNNTMSGYDPITKRYKDASIGDTPKIYTIDLQGTSTRVVAVGCKNGGFYLLRASNGEILANTPIYSGRPDASPLPARNPRMLAYPSPIGGIQTGCATDGNSIFTNGIDWLKLNMPKLGLPRPDGGRIVSLSLDLAEERWRHERDKVKSLLGSSGDPVASGVALTPELACFTTTVSKKLVVLDSASGQLLREIDIDTVWSGPSVSRGRVYVGTGSMLFLGMKMHGTLYSFGLPIEDEVDQMGAGNETTAGR